MHAEIINSYSQFHAGIIIMKARKLAHHFLPMNDGCEAINRCIYINVAHFKNLPKIIRIRMAEAQVSVMKLSVIHKLRFRFTLLCQLFI